MQEAGFEFEVKTREVDESYPPTLSAEKVAAFIAEKKADGCLDFLEDNSILLTSDTTVVLGEEIF